MRIVLREEKYKCNIQDLSRRGYKDYIFVQIGNKRGFIVSSNANVLVKLSTQTWFQAMVEVTENVPLYKQDMQLRMGRVPNKTTSRLRPYNVQVLEKCQDRYCYFIWSVI